MAHEAQADKLFNLESLQGDDSKLGSDYGLLMTVVHRFSDDDNDYDNDNDWDGNDDSGVVRW